MNYLLTPLHKHSDLGFGAAGDSYKDAADLLENGVESLHFNRHLPINFLRRHASELYLKSGIIIFHRVFKLPFGTEPWDGEPRVLERAKWRPMYKTHSVLPQLKSEESVNEKCRVVEEVFGVRP